MAYENYDWQNIPKKPVKQSTNWAGNIIGGIGSGAGAGAAIGSVVPALGTAVGGVVGGVVGGLAGVGESIFEGDKLRGENAQAQRDYNQQMSARDAAIAEEKKRHEEEMLRLKREHGQQTIGALNSLAQNAEQQARMRSFKKLF